MNNTVGWPFLLDRAARRASAFSMSAMRGGAWAGYFAAIVSVGIALSASGALAQTAPAPLQKMDSLECGGAKASIQTTCLVYGDASPPHCTQRLSFNSGAVSSYRPDPGNGQDEPFVNRLSCNLAGEKLYVLAHSSNFGNCSDCEWIDVFTVHGKFIGSTSSVTRALKLPRKRLSINLQSSLDQSREKEFVSIDRTVSKKLEK